VNSGTKVSAFDPHQRYKELCALAAAGDLSEADGVELNEHLKNCEECRKLVRDFAFLCVQILPAATAREPLPPGMTERFIARARSEGILISDGAKEAIIPKRKEPPLRNIWKTAFWAAVAACLFMGGILLWVVKPASKTPPASVIVKGAPPTVGPGSSEKPSSGSEPAVKSGVEPDIQTLEAQLRSTEVRLATLTEELKQRQLELDRLHKSSNKPLSPDAEAELRSLRATVERQKRRLNEWLRLNAAERSTGGLLASRNLHVIDVFPIDVHGKPRHEFAGRLLYIEGKRLEFYALDLDHYPGVDANRTFCLWGQRRDAAEGKGRIIPLGIFSLDDPKDNRWIVVVSDPAVLAGLRSVFVTVESTPHPITPTGKKMLITPLHAEPD
jgi:hypothetical protein